MDIYSIRKQNLISLIGKRKKNVCAQLWDISPAYLSQILSEKTDKNLGDEVARRIEAVEQLPYGWMDAAHADDADSPGPTQTAGDKILEMLQKHGRSLGEEARRRIADAVADSPNDLPPPQTDGSNVIVADFSRRTLVGDEIRIAHYDVRGAMGGGKLVQDYPEMFKDVTVSQSYLRELGISYRDPAHLKVITGEGQSMAPKIQHMDPMISDVSIREFTGDGIYAFVWQDHFYIKSLQIEDEDHFLMVSMDKDLYPPRRIRIDDTYIQARILLVWNAKRV